jgi:hypothetical protein
MSDYRIDTEELERLQARDARRARNVLRPVLIVVFIVTTVAILGYGCLFILYWITAGT